MLGVVSLAALSLIARPLLFASLQPELAEARGVPLVWCRPCSWSIVALSTVEAMQIVGVLLVFALMVAPAATALRLTRRVGSGVALSVVLAVAIAWVSLVLAFLTDWPTSFWITALGGLAYFATSFWRTESAGRCRTLSAPGYLRDKVTQ